MRYLIGLMVIAIAISSCSKAQLPTGSVAALQVTNTIVGGGNIGFNTKPGDSIVAYRSKVFSMRSGDSSIVFYPTKNPAKPYYNNVQTIVGGDIYTIFLHGKFPDVEMMWIKDHIPPYFTDSSLGVRIINLSPNSTPIDITLASATSNKLFSKINYKELTEFLVLPLKSNMPAGSVSFQVRNSIDNTVLATYTLPISVVTGYANISTTLSINRCITLVVKGWQGETIGVDAFGIFPIANY